MIQEKQTGKKISEHRVHNIDKQLNRYDARKLPTVVTSHSRNVLVCALGGVSTLNTQTHLQISGSYHFPVPIPFEYPYQSPYNLAKQQPHDRMCSRTGPMEGFLCIHLSLITPGLISCTMGLLLELPGNGVVQQVGSG